MRIALIAPPYPLQEAPSPPLGLCYAAAACEAAGAEVRIFDYIVRQYAPQKLADEMDSFRPDAIGISSVTMNFKVAAAIAAAAKRHDPRVVIFMGGPHVTFDAENVLNEHPAVDLIVRGEGEETLMELMPQTHQRENWQGIAGISFRQDGGILHTTARALIADLDRLPLPARHLLPLSRYQALGFPISIITSRGCPNRCIFCLGRKMVGHKVRFRSTAKVVDEIAAILDYGFTRINIADDLFTANSARAMELCDRIIERGLNFQWSAFARVNTVDTELLKKMRSAGCDSVSFGIESGNAEMLKRVRKGITVDQARAAVQACREAGLIAHASFMVGLPGESPDTMEDSRRLAAELDIQHGYHFLSPFPGTTVRDEVASYDLEILSNDWDLYDANQPIVRTSALEPEAMAAFVKGCEQVQHDQWKEMKKRYEAGQCSTHEIMLIEGFTRMKLIFAILSNDLIEKHGRIAPAEASPLDCLAGNIALETGHEKALVSFTIKTLIDSGLIKATDRDGMTVYAWTHNNRTENLG